MYVWVSLRNININVISVLIIFIENNLFYLLCILLVIGDEKAFKPLKKFKQKLESELMERRIPVKRKHEECEENESIRKKSLKDIDLRKLLDFSLHIMSKLESDDKKQLKQIVQLVVNIDDAFVNI